MHHGGIRPGEAGIDKGYVFNRKEAKTYGDKSTVVGMNLTSDTGLSGG